MPSPILTRRRCLQAGVAAGLLPLAGRLVAATGATVDVAEALRRGGVVIAFRHALAPGTFDPPGFRLDDCSTQRNLNDEGREQARRLGAWFRERQLVPAAVRSSPWCRCMETARLAFGQAQSWDPLSSPRREDGTDAQRMAALREALAAVPAGRFEAWVSHQFTLSALVGQSTSSGEGLLLQAGDNGAPRLLARFDPPDRPDGARAMDDRDHIRQTIRTVPDWPAPGVQFRDITPLLQDPRTFRILIDQFVHRYFDLRPDAIAGLDARGFIIGSVLAYELNVGFVPIRKKGKLPFTTLEETYELEYGSASVEVHTDAVKPGQRVLLIDDLIATGGTMMAGKRLLERLGATVIEGAAIVDLPELGGADKLRASGLPLFTLVSFAGH